MDTDTLIVGAGPTGLMLANQLGRRGVRTLIIDRHSGPAQSMTLNGFPADAPRGGDRFPWMRVRFGADGPVEDLFQKLDDTRFNLLAFGQEAPAGAAAGLGDLVRVHAVPADSGNEVELARARVPRTSYYLLRPDGHVGLCGSRLDPAAVAGYVSGRLRVRAGGA